MNLLDSDGKIIFAMWKCNLILNLVNLTWPPRLWAGVTLELLRTGGGGFIVFTDARLAILVTFAAKEKKNNAEVLFYANNCEFIVVQFNLYKKR